MSIPVSSLPVKFSTTWSELCSALSCCVSCCMPAVVKSTKLSKRWVCVVATTRTDRVLPKSVAVVVVPSCGEHRTRCWTITRTIAMATTTPEAMIHTTMVKKAMSTTTLLRHTVEGGLLIIFRVKTKQTNRQKNIHNSTETTGIG